MKARDIFAVVLFTAVTGFFSACVTPGDARQDSAQTEVGFQGTTSLLSQRDKAEILSVAQSIPKRKEPVLWIEVKSKSEVDVYTGEVRGPLDGGGPVFKLRKERGRWRHVDDGEVSVWMS